ncbi:MAG: NAD(P)-binding protein, partial [Pseudobdellovibrio sp.]
MSNHLKNHYRIVILGAGLSGSLIALKLHELNIDDFLLVEQNPELSLRTHTWSFFSSDV